MRAQSDLSPWARLIVSVPFAQIAAIDPADLGYPCGRELGHALLQFAVAHGVGFDVVVVHPVMGEDLVKQPVHQRDVGSGQRCQVHGCAPGHRGWARVHA